MDAISTMQSSLSANAGIAAGQPGSPWTVAPPDTTAPVPSSLVSGGGALNLPPASTPDNGSGVVSSAIVGNTPPPTDGTTPSDNTDYSKDPTYIAANQKYEQGIQDYKTAVDNEPSHNTLMNNAESANDVPGILDKIKTIDTQIAEKTAAFNNASQSKEVQGIQQGTPAVFYQGEQAAIQRQQAVVIGGLSAVKAALQGNYDLAESRAKQTADLQFADAEKKITNAENFIKLNENNLNNAEKIAVAKIKANVTQAKTDLTAQKANVTLALSNGVESQFFTKPDGTVVRTEDGKAFSTPEEAFAAGVLPDYSNAPRIQNVGKSETKNINGKLIHVTWNKAGTKVISQTDLGPSGTPKTGKTGKSSSTPSGYLPPKSEKALHSQADQAFAQVKGTDGYVSPDAYNKAQAYFVSKGGTVQAFNSKHKNWTNPAHPQDYNGIK